MRWGMPLAAAVLAITLSGEANAQSAPTLTPAQRTMSRRMHTYFRGELDAASMALGLGAGSGWAGGMLLAQATDGSRAAAVPVLAVGAVEVAIGIGLFLRTPAQVRELDALIARDPKRYVEEEGARMARVNDNFDLLTIAETTLLFSGAITTTIGAVIDEDRAVGAGVGVVVQAAFGMAFDALAHARAEEYAAGIEAFRRVQMMPTIETSGGITSYGLMASSSF